MPITFTIDTDKGYFISKYKGIVSNDELIGAYREFYEGDIWWPELNELVDVSNVDLGSLSVEGIKRIAEYTQTILGQHGIDSVKCAIYAPHDLPFGIARMYEAFTYASPESVRVFSDLIAAEEWLQSEQ